jgi:hypothetical protein
METRDKVTAILLMICVVCVVVLGYSAILGTAHCPSCDECKSCRTVMDSIERGEIYYSDNKANLKSSANGVYFGEGYYCVWTKDRDYCDIMTADPSVRCVNKTALHEVTHSLIADYGAEHFCDINYSRNKNWSWYDD